MSDGLCFHIRNEGSNAFLFRTSDSHLEVSPSLVEAAFLQGLTTLTDGFSVNGLRSVVQVSYHSAVVASLESELKEQISSRNFPQETS